MTVGKYHELTRMEGFSFAIVNDDTNRILCAAKNYAELSKTWIPIYGRYKLEYSSRTHDNRIEYHICCGMTVNDHIKSILGNQRTIGVACFDIRDICGKTLLLTTYKEKFNPGIYGLYPVKSKRICFNKVILKIGNRPLDGEDE